MTRDKNRGGGEILLIPVPPPRGVCHRSVNVSIARALLLSRYTPCNRAYPSSQFGVSWLISQDNAFMETAQVFNSMEGGWDDKNHAKLWTPSWSGRGARWDVLFYGFFPYFDSSFVFNFSWNAKCSVIFLFSWDPFFGINIFFMVCGFRLNEDFEPQWYKYEHVQ